MDWVFGKSVTGSQAEINVFYQVKYSLKLGTQSSHFNQNTSQISLFSTNFFPGVQFNTSFFTFKLRSIIGWSIFYNITDICGGESLENGAQFFLVKAGSLSLFWKDFDEQPPLPTVLSGINTSLV